MIHLIDKDALVAELKKRISDYWSDSENTMGIYPYALEEVIKYVGTLEVKEEFKIGETQIYLEDDGGEPPYDGKQWLDLSCTEYEIPEDKFKDGDKVELIIRKAQKGE